MEKYKELNIPEYDKSKKTQRDCCLSAVHDKHSCGLDCLACMFNYHNHQEQFQAWDAAGRPVDENKKVIADPEDK